MNTLTLLRNECEELCAEIAALEGSSPEEVWSDTLDLLDGAGWDMDKALDALTEDASERLKELAESAIALHAEEIRLVESYAASQTAPKEGGAQ